MKDISPSQQHAKVMREKGNKKKERKIKKKQKNNKTIAGPVRNPHTMLVFDHDKLRASAPPQGPVLRTFQQ